MWQYWWQWILLKGTYYLRRKTVPSRKSRSKVFVQKNASPVEDGEHRFLPGSDVSNRLCRCGMGRIRSIFKTCNVAKRVQGFTTWFLSHPLSRSVYVCQEKSCGNIYQTWMLNISKLFPTPTHTHIKFLTSFLPKTFLALLCKTEIFWEAVSMLWIQISARNRGTPQFLSLRLPLSPR